MPNLKSKNKLLPLILFLFLGVLVGVVLKEFRTKNSGEQTNPKTVISQIPKNSEEPPRNATTTPKATSTPPTITELPKVMLLPVPFTSQAPTANWDDKIYAEGCEEASTLMASQYFSGNENTNLPTDFALSEIKKITDWELQTFGYNLDINTAETVRIVKEFYGLNAEIVSNYTENDIKTYLAQGKVVLLPANGQMLGNPNFRAPGPPYHMLVIKGYNSMGIVTNDPGTRKGLNYLYSFDVLYNANGDFNHATGEVDVTKKMVIVVSK